MAADEPAGPGRAHHEKTSAVAEPTYRTPGPTPDRYGPMCYWERLRGTSGSFNDIIANGISFHGPIVVTLAPTDRAFRSEGCQPWVRI
ncbi:MAG: hypothetical protein ACXV5Q_10660 [Frankiaceae bacterium]